VDGVDLVAIKKNTFRKSRFPRINVGADPDVPHLGNVDAHLVLTPIARLFRRLINRSQTLRSALRLFKMSDFEKGSLFDKSPPGVPANTQEDKNAKNSLNRYNIAQFSIFCKYGTRDCAAVLRLPLNVEKYP
jgi:hypothetical protein